MSVNSSSSIDCHVPPHISPNNSNLLSVIHCSFIRPNSFIYTSFNITYIILLLPLCSFILCHGLQQWRQKRSTSSAVTMSHSDSFTYHLVTMELIQVFGHVIGCCSIYMENLNMLSMWGFLSAINWFGTTFFHVLTCVERYLAVVHPITYLSLRRERGIRLRNITIGCVWLLCFVAMFLMMVPFFYYSVDIFFMALSFTIVSFCSLSVLRILIRPGPGEKGGGRERIDQSKLRAFYTIVTILGALLLRFALSLVTDVLVTLDESNECGIMACVYWLNLPSSLVLPLLFLHRKGKLVCCKNNNQRG